MGAVFRSNTEVGTWTALVAAPVLPSKSYPRVEDIPGCLGTQRFGISFGPDRDNGSQAHLISGTSSKQL